MLQLKPHGPGIARVTFGTICTRIALSVKSARMMGAWPGTGGLPLCEVLRSAHHGRCQSPCKSTADGRAASNSGIWAREVQWTRFHPQVTCQSSLRQCPTRFARFCRFGLAMLFGLISGQVGRVESIRVQYSLRQVRFWRIAPSCRNRRGASKSRTDKLTMDPHSTKHSPWYIEAALDSSDLSSFSWELSPSSWDGNRPPFFIGDPF